MTLPLATTAHKAPVKPLIRALPASLTQTAMAVSSGETLTVLLTLIKITARPECTIRRNALMPPGLIINANQMTVQHTLIRLA